MSGDPGSHGRTPFLEEGLAQGFPWNPGYEFGVKKPLKSVHVYAPLYFLNFNSHNKNDSHLLKAY